jgi:hypothetical protein
VRLDAVGPRRRLGVMATIAEVLPASEIEYVRAALPADYDALLQERRPPSVDDERATEPV